jgi:micrococcal nuclease
MYEYNATVKQVHDGDTLTVDVDLGFKQWAHDQQIRLIGIQAPENNTEAGAHSTAFLKGLLVPGTAITLVTVKDKREKYGRMLGDVFFGDIHVNTALVDQGYAVAWDGKGARPQGF